MPHLDLELGEVTPSASAAPPPAQIVRVGEESERSVAVDLESGSGAPEPPKIERDCRICHLSLEQTDLDSDPASASAAIVLGCSCKDDLAAAHKHCAEAWFNIKGHVRFVELESMEQWSEPNDMTRLPQPVPHLTETQNFWRGHRFLNFLLACMVFAFVISWLFHFNIHLRET